MKLATLAAGLFAALLLAGGCNHTASDTDAIRAGVMQHLRGLGTLNLDAMDVNITNVSINGNQAHADVEFRPKTGGSPDARMQVVYNLEKRDGAWVVLKSESAGGTINHPAPGQNPAQGQIGQPCGVPALNDLLNHATVPAQGALPPGHPPINSQSGAQAQAPPKKRP